MGEPTNPYSFFSFKEGGGSPTGDGGGLPAGESVGPKKKKKRKEKERTAKEDDASLEEENPFSFFRMSGGGGSRAGMAASAPVAQTRENPRVSRASRGAPGTTGGGGATFAESVLPPVLPVVSPPGSGPPGSGGDSFPPPVPDMGVPLPAVDRVVASKERRRRGRRRSSSSSSSSSSCPGDTHMRTDRTKGKPSYEELEERLARSESTLARLRKVMKQRDAAHREERALWEARAVEGHDSANEATVLELREEITRLRKREKENAKNLTDYMDKIELKLKHTKQREAALEREVRLLQARLDDTQGSREEINRSAHFASQQLLKVSDIAEAGIKRMFEGIEDLRLAASTLANLDRITSDE